MFAFVAVADHGGSAAKLRTYRMLNGMWRLTHEITLPTPVQVTAHPTLPVIYLRHEVALWEHLPRGAVSAYRMNAADGTLTHLCTQSLSLAATYPTFAAVTASGASLFVGTQAGIYNVLPLASDGSLLPVVAIRKEYGRTAADAAVHAVAHPDGTMLIVDAGQGTLSRFRLTDDEVHLQHRIPTRARQIALSGCGRWAYALHADDASVAVHRIDAGGLCAAHQTVAGSGGRASLFASPCGRFLLRADADALSVLPLDPQTGVISGPSEMRAVGLRHWTALPGGRQLAGFDPSTGEVMTIALRQGSRVLGSRVLGAMHSVTQGITDGASLAFLPERCSPRQTSDSGRAAA